MYGCLHADDQNHVAADHPTVKADRQSQGCRDPATFHLVPVEKQKSDEGKPRQFDQGDGESQAQQPGNAIENGVNFVHACEFQPKKGHSTICNLQ